MAALDDTNDERGGAAKVVAVCRPQLDPTPAELAAFAQVERNVLASLAQPAAPRRWRWAVAAGAALATAAAALVFVLRTPTGKTDAPFVASGAAEVGAGVVRAPAASSATMRFREGTLLELAGGSAAEVTAFEQEGRSARVRLRHGRARAQVVHRRGTRWIVEAGPFTVTVTGTTFDVDWAPQRERFELHMAQGSVEVHGPLLQEGVKLGASNSLIVDLAAGLVSLRDAAEGGEAPTPPDPEAAVPLPFSPRQAAPTIKPRGAGRMEAARKPKPEAGASWAVALSGRRFDAIVAEAEAAGLRQTLAERPIVDLVALADAARFTRRYDIARATLTSVRTRAPQSNAAADAAFFLGWLADEEGQKDEALAWFERYGSAHPNGPYAEQALGRRLLIAARAKRPAAALAAEYLRRFPAGAHAQTARALQAP